MNFPEPVQPKKANKTTWIIIVVVALVLLCCILVAALGGLYLYLKQNGMLPSFLPGSVPSPAATEVPTKAPTEPLGRRRRWRSSRPTRPRARIPPCKSWRPAGPARSPPFPRPGQYLFLATSRSWSSWAGALLRQRSLPLISSTSPINWLLTTSRSTSPACTSGICKSRIGSARP